MNDHDLLIRVDAKVDQLSIDIRDVKDGVNSRICALEDKVIGYDKLINEISPLTMYTMLNKHDKFIHDFNLTKKLLFVVISTIGGLIGALITLGLQALRLFKGL